jgi:hypothetical protein
VVAIRQASVAASLFTLDQVFAVSILFDSAAERANSSLARRFQISVENRGVAVEKLAHFDFAKTASRQEAL